MSKKISKDMHLVPYCGMRSNPPKNRRPGTLDECLKAGQVRYYGVQAQATKSNQFLEEEKKVSKRKGQDQTTKRK